MKRAYGVWVEYTHNDNTGKYELSVTRTMDFHGRNVVLATATNEPKPYQYESIADMTCDILSWLKEKNYYCKWYRQFGSRWYEIWFKDTQDTGYDSWNRYGVTDEYIQLYNSEHYSHITKVGEYK